jgi:hypothetical protein
LDDAPPLLRIRPPASRPLKVYAFDPTLGRTLGNVLLTHVPYEPLKPGPVGERFAVIDYDGSAKTFYTPVDLDDPHILMRSGLDPTESDPRFHQQMVYAVASETLERFETALGRRVHWRRTKNPLPPGVPNRLYLYPHAMVQANAFYSPDAHGILFGYFRAAKSDWAQVLPGQTIFTCLSHDIIAHETTHAIVDGIRSYFMEPTNIDVPAFHEAFADVSALFVHFSNKDAVLATLQRTGGRLYSTALTPESGGSVSNPMIQAEIAPDNPLIELARQFGQVSGMHSGLRSALGTPPTPADILTTVEPHARGSILVAAVFDAFFSIYMQQTADLFRTFRAGGGPANPVDLPAPLADQLAQAVRDTAVLFFGVCARALDYCPPVDVTFGDFLRALITADYDLFPSDKYGVREAVMQSFRSRGILPQDAAFFSEGSLRWPELLPGQLPYVRGLVFGDPNGLTRAEQDTDGRVLRQYARTHAKALGLTQSGPISADSFHPMFRTDERGRLRVDMVVELTQKADVLLDSKAPALGSFPMRSGVTLLIAQPLSHAEERGEPWVRYAISKHASPQREAGQRAAYAALGLSSGPARINFGLLHGV